MSGTITRETIIDRERQLSDVETVRRAKKAVDIELEKRYAMNMPIAVFDKSNGKVYASYPDGTKVQMGQSTKIGKQDGQ